MVELNLPICVPRCFQKWLLQIFCLWVTSYIIQNWKHKSDCQSVKSSFTPFILIFSYIEWLLKADYFCKYLCNRISIIWKNLGKWKYNNWIVGKTFMQKYILIFMTHMLSALKCVIWGNRNFRSTSGKLELYCDT